MSLATHKQRERFLVLPLGLALVDLAYQKGASDPLNPVKLWVLGLVAVWAFADLVTTRHILGAFRSERIFRIFGSILGIFAASFFVAFLLTPVKSVGLFGDTGRNVGLLNYLFLILVSFYSAYKVSLENIKNIYWTVFALNLVLTLYGFLQHFKIDFLQWKTQYNPIILITGNPDFASSLLGLFVVVSVAGLFLEFNILVKVMIGSITVTTGVVIYWTQARQGLVSTIVGLGFVALVLIWQKRKKAAILLFVLELIAGVFSILGMLQVGPLTKYFFKASITDRGYNWRAAIGMLKSHPWFGVGVDRYAAYFLQYRSPKYPLLYGYTQTVTNAHNVFLEIFATAGVFAGLAYLAFIVFVGFRAFIALKKSSGKKQIVIAGIIGGWIVFLAQSIISVDSLVISIWGWVLGGAIVGLSIGKTEITPPTSGGRTPKSGSGARKRGRSDISPYRSIVFSITLVALCLIVVPMYRNETSTLKFSSIQAPNDPAGQDTYRAIAKRTFNQPLLNPNYKTDIAVSMAKNNYGPEAINYFKETLKTDPRNTNSYSLLGLVYENLKRPNEAIPLRKELAKLDPYGAENLLSLENDYLITGDEKSAAETSNAIITMAPGTDIAKRAEKLLAQKSVPPKK
jgi:O-antigen ligase